MENKSLVFVINIAVLLLSSSVSAQNTSPQIQKEWRFVTEKQMVDVFYKLIECNHETQVFLMVLNDKPEKREISFTINITDPTNKKVSKEITLKAAEAERMVPECSIDKWHELKIDLPRGFNITELSVKAEFKK